MTAHAFRKNLSASELQDWREKRRRSWERLDPQFRTPRQLLGRQLAIGCVSLEITQRCNLDCTLCYLSDLSESIPDTPIEEIKRRADLIIRDWGPNTNVQISGGDPTLRKRDELIEIFRYCRSIGLLPALFTNGILAKRELLVDLCKAGTVSMCLHNARRNEFLLMGVDRLIKNPVERGKRREKEAELPPELRGPVAPGAGGLPARQASTPRRSN